jgi:hypothetical protein
MRKALLAAAIAGLAIVLYAAAGYWLAPRFVHDALVERAGRLGLALELDAVRTDPFALEVTLDGVRVLSGGRELARAQRFAADLGWASLWGDAWVVQQAALHEPSVELALGRQGDLNWPVPQRGGERNQPQQLPLVIQQLAVNGGALHFVDRSRAAPVELRLQAIGLRVEGLSTQQGAKAHYELSARSADGGSVSAQGNLSLDPVSSQGKLTLSAVPLATVWSLVAPASEPGSGQAHGAAAYAYDGEKLVLSDASLEGARVAHSGVALSSIALRSPRIVLPSEEGFRVSGDAALAPEGRLSASGTLAVAPFSADLQVELAGLPLAQAQPWLPEDVAVSIASGALSANGRARVQPGEASYEGALSVRGARFEERGSDELLLAWEILETDQASVSFAPFGVELGEVVAQSPSGRLVLGEDEQSEEKEENEQKAEKEAMPRIAVQKLRVENGTLHFAHRSLEKALQATVREVQGTVEGFSTAERGPARVALSAQVALPSGESFPASAKGAVAMQPFSADLQVALERAPLAQANRWIPESVAVTIASGALSVDGRLRVSPQRTSYEGAVAVRDARFEERGSGQLLLGWKDLATKQATLSLDPFRAELGEVVAQAPAGRLVIEEGGRLNFAALFKGRDEKKQQGAPPRVAVRRLRIENGTLDFADRSLDNDFAVTIRELSGAVTGFSSEPGNPARVQLAGRVEQYGSARIRGTIDLDAPKSLTNVVATFRNLPLAQLTPYIVRFAGYRVKSGRVSAELRYRVRDARLAGQNELTFEELQLGEKVQGAGAKDLPLELAVALLADSKGRINLDIPVSGDLNDPQFDLGGLVARALGNAIGKIVSAPFRVLAAAFGKGGEELDRVAFAPGSAELTPPAEENVAQVAGALGQRPRLGVTVQGGYDPQSDLEALRRDAVRREIAQRAGVAGKGPLDFGDPKVLQAAERLYLSRVGNRLEMLALRNSEPRYGRALLQKLAGQTPVQPQAAETLARARAETVRAALLAQGIDASRIRLDAPATRDAAKEGVPTVLALEAGGGAAAAGATGR